MPSTTAANSFAIGLNRMGTSVANITRSGRVTRACEGRRRPHGDSTNSSTAAKRKPIMSGDAKVLSSGWLDNAPEGDLFVGSHGRVFDLIVLGKPGRDARGPRMTTLEAALFDSGRPVL